jgi:hypothetical protein
MGQKSGPVKEPAVQVVKEIDPDPPRDHRDSQSLPVKIQARIPPMKLRF